MKHRPRCVINDRWSTRAHEAFRADFDHRAEAVKVMAAWLIDAGFWPQTLSLDGAVSKFRHALNGTHGERFRTQEIIALSCQFGGNALLAFWAASAGFRLVEVPDGEFDAELVEGIDARLSQIQHDIGELRDMRQLIEQRNQHDARIEAESPTRTSFSREGPL
jgi:hypothetical protein